MGIDSWAPDKGLQIRALTGPTLGSFVPHINAACFGAVKRGHKDCRTENGIPRDVNESYVYLGNTIHAGRESSNEGGPAA